MKENEIFYLEELTKAEVITYQGERGPYNKENWFRVKTHHEITLLLHSPLNVNRLVY